jgi:hypothetical protein
MKRSKLLINSPALATDLLSKALDCLNFANSRLWLRLETAAGWINTSEDSIGRRGIPWQEFPVPHRIRYKFLALDEDTRQVRRYFAPDVLALLIDPSQ